MWRLRMPVLFSALELCLAGDANQLVLTFWARSQRIRDLLHEPMISSIHDRVRQPHREQRSDRGQQRLHLLRQSV